MPEMTFSEVIEENDRYFTNREQGRTFTDEQVKECLDLLYNNTGMPSHRREFLIREALTTSDFPYLFGDVLDRQVLARYKAITPVWRTFCKVGKVRRIYPLAGGYRFQITGGDQYLAQVGEKGEYLASERDETRYAVYVKKYGRQFDISWEALINDDLGALQDTPARFADAAMRTEHRLVTGTYAGDVGTHAGGNLYQVGVNAVATALSVASLTTGVQHFEALTDANGEPIDVGVVTLVVPPALKILAMQLLKSTNLMWVESAGGAATAYPMASVIPDLNLNLVVDKYLPVLDTTSDEEGWYLFANPGSIAAIEADYLDGHERPEICMKASDKVSVGGGAIGPMSGDFATDNVFYRVRDVFGANKIDWRATYMGGYQG